jgi:hypothetical protein
LTRASRTLLGVLLAVASLLAIAVPAAFAQDEARTIVFHVPLSGGDTGDPDGHGEAVLRFTPATGTLCYVVVVRGIGEPTEPAPNLGNAHIHGPLPATGIAVDLESEFLQRGKSDVYMAADCVSVNAAMLEAILANPSLFYVNVHTVEFPGGAISGTLA